MVADKNSFVRAAAELGMSAPALSQSVRALEEQLGVQLFRRTTRSVATTEAGAALALRLRPVLVELDRVVGEVATRDAEPRGVVRINLPRAACEVVGGWMTRFCAAHPHVTLELSVDDSLADIVAQRFDAGIRLGERLAKDMVAIAISEPLSQVAVASPSYFRAHGKPGHPRELEAHRCINMRMSTHGEVYRWEFERRGRALDVAVQGPLLVSDSELALRGALDGLGIAYLFRNTVTSHLRARRLIAVLEEWSPTFPGLYLYYPRHRNAAPAARAFLDFVRAEVKRAK